MTAADEVTQRSNLLDRQPSYNPVVNSLTSESQAVWSVLGVVALPNLLSLIQFFASLSSQIGELTKKKISLFNTALQNFIKFEKYQRRN